MIQRRQTAHPRTRREEMPLRILVHILHHALFIAAVGVAEPRLKAIKALQIRKRIRHLPLVSAQNPRHQRFVVVVDHDAGNPAEEEKRLLVPFQPGLLLLERERHAEDRIGITERHGEDIDPRHLAMDENIRFKEVHLRLRHRLRQRNVDFLVLPPQAADQITDRPGTAVVIALFHQTLVDALWDMPLLLAGGMIFRKNLLNEFEVGGELFQRAGLAGLIARRSGIGEDFLDDAVIDAVLAAERIEGRGFSIIGVEIIVADRIPEIHAGVHSFASDGLQLSDACLGKRRHNYRMSARLIKGVRQISTLGAYFRALHFSTSIRI